MDAQGAAPAAATSSQEQPAAADAEVSGREEGQVVPGRRKPPEQLLRARIALRRAISELGPGLEAARAKLQAQLGQLEESFQAYHSSRQHSLLVFCVSAYTLDALVRAGYANSALRGAQALVRAATSASRAVVGLALRPLRLLRPHRRRRLAPQSHALQHQQQQVAAELGPAEVPAEPVAAPAAVNAPGQPGFAGAAIFAAPDFAAAAQGVQGGGLQVLDLDEDDDEGAQGLVEAEAHALFAVQAAAAVAAAAAAAGGQLGAHQQGEGGVLPAGLTGSTAGDAHAGPQPRPVIVIARPSPPRQRRPVNLPPVSSNTISPARSLADLPGSGRVQGAATPPRPPSSSSRGGGSVLPSSNLGPGPGVASTSSSRPGSSSQLRQLQDPEPAVQPEAECDATSTQQEATTAPVAASSAADPAALADESAAASTLAPAGAGSSSSGRSSDAGEPGCLTEPSSAAIAGPSGITASPQQPPKAKGEEQVASAQQQQGEQDLPRLPSLRLPGVSAGRPRDLEQQQAPAAGSSSAAGDGEGEGASRQESPERPMDPLLEAAVYTPTSPLAPLRMPPPPALRAPSTFPSPSTPRGAAAAELRADPASFAAALPLAPSLTSLPSAGSHLAGAGSQSAGQSTQSNSLSAARLNWPLPSVASLLASAFPASNNITATNNNNNAAGAASNSGAGTSGIGGHTSGITFPSGAAAQPSPTPTGTSPGLASPNTQLRGLLDLISPGLGSAGLVSTSPPPSSTPSTPAAPQQLRPLERVSEEAEGPSSSTQALSPPLSPRLGRRSDGAVPGEGAQAGGSSQAPGPSFARHSAGAAASDGASTLDAKGGHSPAQSGTPAGAPPRSPRQLGRRSRPGSGASTPSARSPRHTPVPPPSAFSMWQQEVVAPPSDAALSATSGVGAAQGQGVAAAEAAAAPPAPMSDSGCEQVPAGAAPASQASAPVQAVAAAPATIGQAAPVASGSGSSSSRYASRPAPSTSLVAPGAPVKAYRRKLREPQQAHTESHRTAGVQGQQADASTASGSGGGLHLPSLAQQGSRVLPQPGESGSSSSSSNGICDLPDVAAAPAADQQAAAPSSSSAAAAAEPSTSQHAARGAHQAEGRRAVHAGLIALEPPSEDEGAARAAAAHCHVPSSSTCTTRMSSGDAAEAPAAAPVAPQLPPQPSAPLPALSFLAQRASQLGLLAAPTLATALAVESDVHAPVPAEGSSQRSGSVSQVAQAHLSSMAGTSSLRQQPQPQPLPPALSPTPSTCETDNEANSMLAADSEQEGAAGASNAAAKRAGYLRDSSAVGMKGRQGSGAARQGRASAAETVGITEEGTSGVSEGEQEAGEVCGQEEEEDEQAGVLGLPECVGAHLLTHLDADGVRVLRAVNRSLYFEASRTVQVMVVTPDNLETLVEQPLHALCPMIHTLIFRAPGFPPPSSLPPCPLVMNTVPGPQPPATHLPLLAAQPLPPSVAAAAAAALASVGGGGGAAFLAAQLAAAVAAPAAAGHQQEHHPGAVPWPLGVPDNHVGLPGIGMLAAVSAPVPQQGAAAQEVTAQADFDQKLLLRFAKEVMPNLHHLRTIDMSDAVLHTPSAVWATLVAAAPSPHTKWILREPSVWVRGAMGMLGVSEGGGKENRDHFPGLYDAIQVITARQAQFQQQQALHQVQGIHALLDGGAGAPGADVGAAAGLGLNNANSLALQLAQQVQQQRGAAGAAAGAGGSTSGVPYASNLQGPGMTVELNGITVRRHTAQRLPQLCALQCITSLTLFGKSAIANPHGHRLAGHLGALSGLRQLARLELLSYEDVSDAELAPLTDCPRLTHLYVDSLFIKQAVGPVFPSLTSLTVARIKFILRPLTAIFPALKQLRLGVLHSELNKKISSASLSCLAGCSEQLTKLCVCPVLWKGQWQVLPTLPGLTHLQLVHCRDLSHLREVLRVVGRSPALTHLELHTASFAVPPWPGASADSDAAGGGGNAALASGPAAAVAAAAAAAAAAAGAAAQAAGLDAAAVAAASAAAAAAVEEAAEAPGAVMDANLFAGLSGAKNLRTLVLSECSGRLVRHLVGCELPGLRKLVLRKMGAALRLPDLQAAVLTFPSLHVLQLESSGDFGPGPALDLPTILSRPALEVAWKSSCPLPSLFLTRDCGPEDE